MPINRISRSSWKLLNPYLCTPPIRSALHPGACLTQNHTQTRPNGSATEKWTGSTNTDHTVNKLSERDDSDPESSASEASMKEKEEYHGISDHSKSHATTQRDGLSHGRKAKEEHPKAPEPIIGMNDERGKKGY